MVEEAFVGVSSRRVITDSRTIIDKLQHGGPFGKHSLQLKTRLSQLLGAFDGLLCSHEEPNVRIAARPR